MAFDLGSFFGGFATQATKTIVDKETDERDFGMRKRIAAFNATQQERMEIGSENRKLKRDEAQRTAALTAMGYTPQTVDLMKAGGAYSFEFAQSVNELAQSRNMDVNEIIKLSNSTGKAPDALFKSGITVEYPEAEREKFITTEQAMANSMQTISQLESEIELGNRVDYNTKLLKDEKVFQKNLMTNIFGDGSGNTPELSKMSMAQVSGYALQQSGFGKFMSLNENGSMKEILTEQIKGNEGRYASTIVNQAIPTIIKTFDNYGDNEQAQTQSQLNVLNIVKPLEYRMENKLDEQKEQMPDADNYNNAYVYNLAEANRLEDLKNSSLEKNSVISLLTPQGKEFTILWNGTYSKTFAPNENPNDVGSPLYYMSKYDSYFAEVLKGFN